MDKILRISATLVLVTMLCIGYGHAAETPKTWDTVVAQAKKEGVVTIYAIWKPETRVALTQAFRDKYGINLEFVAFVRGEDLTVKASQEKAAGLNIPDVFGVGASSFLTVLKPAGLLGQIKPLLMISEATNPKSWRGEKFPFMDKGQQVIGMMANPNRNIVYNTNLLKKGEITTYKDLLKPQYKGKITMNDPSVTGGGNVLMSHLARNIWNPQEAADFFKQLMTQQDVVLQRDTRIHVESVARGKFAIGLGSNSRALATFISLKAPISVVFDKEGAYIDPGAGAIAVPVNSAHPNAAKVFVNWLLTKEAQTVLAQSFGIPSLRTDVSTAGIAPSLVLQPGEKFVATNEEDILFQPKMRAICKEIIDAAGR